MTKEFRNKLSSLAMIVCQTTIRFGNLEKIGKFATKINLLHHMNLYKFLIFIYSKKAFDNFSMSLLIINPPGAKSKKEQFEICNYF